MINSLTLQSRIRHERSVKPSCGKVWIDGDFWFCVLAAAGVAGAFFLNQAITMAGRKKRRKRFLQQSDQNQFSYPVIGSFLNLGIKQYSM